MIYQTLKIIVRISLRIFFKKTVVINKQALCNKGPLLIVVNHPNTFMDPLIVGSLFRRKVGFLGNASIFVNGIVNAIFRYFNVIPVYRQKDVSPGSQPDNTLTFRACNEYLSAGHALMVFPEGSSYHELKLRKIKTGTARIALSTEAIHHFSLGLKIQPIGLYYSNPAHFRSKIYVHIGEAFDVSDYKDAYARDEKSAVQLLTRQIKQALEQNIINTDTREDEDLFVKIKRIYRNQLLKESDKISSINEFELTREMAKAIQYFKVGHPGLYQRIKTQVNAYTLLLNETELHHDGQNYIYNRFKTALILIGGIAYLLLGLPVFLTGTMLNYLPYKAPYWLARKITREIEYQAPIMLSVGIFLFPLYYALLGAIFCFWSPCSALVLSGFILLLPLSGFYSLHYIDFWRFLRDFMRFHSLFYPRDERITQLQTMKKTLTELLDEAKETYLKRL